MHAQFKRGVGRGSPRRDRQARSDRRCQTRLCVPGQSHRRKPPLSCFLSTQSTFNTDRKIRWGSQLSEAKLLRRTFFAQNVTRKAMAVLWLCYGCSFWLVRCSGTFRSLDHSKPVPLSVDVSGVLSACARRWAQFRVGVAAWGMESRNKPLMMK